jgi:hypothetical protein
MKRIAMAAGAILLLVGAALAQVNTVPQIGVDTAIVKQNTYSAVSIGLVPAASATDIFCISGSSTKAISINPIIWRFGEESSWFSRGLDIPSGSTAQQYCINLNAVSITSGVLHIDTTWVEN